MSRQASPRIAVVTGAGGGIGQALARRFLEQGSAVAAIDREKPEFEFAIEDTSRFIFLKADVCDSAELDAIAAEVLARFGAIHMLMVNAGIGPTGPILEMDAARWSSVVDVNLTGAFNTMKAFLPVMRAGQGPRSVVLLSSVLAMRGARNMAAYSASKAGVLGLMQATAQEFAAYGITVNAVAPGPIRTSLLEGLPGDTLEKLQESVPLKRLGTPEDVADAAIFLSGETATFITGQTLVIDGGLSGRAYWRDN